MSDSGNTNSAEKLESILNDASAEYKQAATFEKVEAVRIKYSGRKSPLNSILKTIKDLPPEERKEIGSKANVIREKLEKLFDARKTDIESTALKNIEQTEKIDITLPGNTQRTGKLHPITQMQTQVENIFQSMGFNVEYAYEIDTDFNNFQALNIPEGHPARDSWDTFWMEDGHLAVTHTSSMQNRVLKATEPPVRTIIVGRTFRNEATDARHEHTFTQVEGVYVDKAITMGDMLGTLQTFFSEFFNQKTEVKFTPDYFPFVEPGGGMALTCVLCAGKGCNVCKYSGWLEILGCGMIHPKVLEAANVDANVYSGFAWGFGLERLIMLKYGIEDVRLFNSGDLKFVRKF